MRSRRARLPATTGLLLLALLALLPAGDRAGAQAPAAPTIDSVTAAETSLTVAWSAPTGVTGITAYDVRYIPTDDDETAAANWTVVDGAWTSGNLEYVIGGLDKGTGYDVQVRAVTATDGEWSATMAATTLTTAPGAPTIDAVSSGERTLGVAWSEPADTGGTMITAYDLRYSEVDLEDWTELPNAWLVDDPDPTEALTRLITGLVAWQEYDVQVRASNSDGTGDWSATRTGYPVRDHAGVQGAATPIALGTLTSGSIDGGPRDWYDWFKLVLVEETELIILTRGSLDTVGELRRGGRVVARNDDSNLAAGPRNFLIAGRFAAGTYHLKVEGYSTRTGDYVLETASLPDTTGRADAMPFAPRTFPNQVIGGAGDTDWFRFTLEEETAVAVSGVGVATIRGRLVDAEGASAADVDSIVFPGRHFLLRTTLAAGTWYVEVRGVSGTGIYHVRLDTFTEPGATRTDATPLVLGEYPGGTIEDADDADYFRIDFSGRATWAHVDIYGRGVLDLEGELLDSDGVTVPRGERTVYGSNPKGFRIARGLKPGVYYLKVTRAAGATGRTSGAYVIHMAEDERYAAFFNGCVDMTTSYSDPLLGCQWHLLNTGQQGGDAGEDINVAGAWGTTMGDGVTVAVVDDGVQLDHEDLVDNTDAARSHDYTGGGLFRRYHTHGTAVAGIVAARDNDLGVRGVAPRATVIGLNFLLSHADANSAHAATHEMDSVAVNTNSWGSGTGYRPAAAIWKMAVERGITEGFGGKGVFYVWSAGNSARSNDNVNYDGIANFYAVTPVCAVTNKGVRSSYSERGAVLWVCAPSSGGSGAITTTTGFRYRPDFGGTSAAAPAVAGVAALVRAANPDLTWRDVKLILAGSARKNDPDNTGWLQGATEYGGGGSYEFNHAYGFGVVDATAAVNLATSWTLLPEQRKRDSDTARPNLTINDPDQGTVRAVSSSITVSPYVEFIEFVEINLEIDHGELKDLKITLTSPSGNVSTLAVPTAKNVFTLPLLFFDTPLQGWVRFGSARHLGEDSSGTWTLTIEDHAARDQGRLKAWRLTFYGHGGPPDRPAIDSTTATGGALTVLWSAPEALDGDPSIDSYDVRYIRSDATDKSAGRWSVVQGAWTAGGGTLSYTIDALTGGVSYDVQVRAVSSKGGGGWSEAVKAKAGDTPPYAPVVTSVVPGDGVLTVSWEAPAESGGQGVTAYDVRHREQFGDWTVVDNAATSARRYAISGLTNQTYYDVAVRAVNAIGDGEWSERGEGKPREVNSAPVFPDIETGERSVDENAPAGEHIGVPIVAEDDDDDPLTYAISGAGARFFAIDAATGQLQTKEALDFESRSSYGLTVTATDVANASATRAVTVTVMNVNEPPVISGPVGVSYPENSTAAVATFRFSDPENDGYTVSLSGDDGYSMSIDDGRTLRFQVPPNYESPSDASGDNVYEVVVVTTDDLGAEAGYAVAITVFDVNDLPAISGPTDVTLVERDPSRDYRFERRIEGSYYTEDEDDPIALLSLAGPDRDDFTLVHNRELYLSTGADFDNPRDANRDNVYHVTIQAWDGKGTASLPVTVTVENIDDPGVVTLSSEYPQVGRRLTATLHDADGAVSGASWEWEGASDASGATSASYTPVADDVGSTLRAVVTYTDAGGSGKVASESSQPVQAVQDRNSPPAFPSTETGVRSLREGIVSGLGFGDPVTAVDPDGDGLTYSLDPAGAALFAIDPLTGQLSSLIAFDHERRSSYRVTVTATDPSGARATQNVTINITNVDERPVISGPSVVFYPDGGTHAVATYSATDPENDAIRWNWDGTDDLHLGFDSEEPSVLRFLSPPDFENPEDANKDNMYEIIITARGSFQLESRRVFVVVTSGAVSSAPTPSFSGGGGVGGGGGAVFAGAGGGGGPSGPSPSMVDFEWNVERDIEALADPNTLPTGAWSDGRTLWLLNNGSGADDAVYAYGLASGERAAEHEFALDEANRAPRGIWSDGETVWVSDSGRDRVFAHGLQSGERLEERDIELVSRNRDARGIWGGDGVIWVLDGGRDALLAYDLESGALLGEFELGASNSDPRGMWSDGITVWVSDHGAKKLFAYRLPEPPETAPDEPVPLERVPAEDFAEPGRVGNNSPRGIWSDGDVMYVADGLDGKVYTYNMPDAIDARLASLALSGVDIGEFDATRTEYEGAPGEGVLETTVTAEAAQAGATVAIEPADADEAAAGHQVALAGPEAITVTVTSADGSRTKTYRVQLPQPEEPAECLRGPVVPGGFSLVLAAGGGLDELEACAADRGVAALYALHGGGWASYVLGAPAFVNHDFVELFAEGLPPGAPLVAKGGEPPSADADASLVSLALEDVDFGAFSPSRTEYVAAAAEGVTRTTVRAEAAGAGASVAITPADADGDPANGHQAALRAGMSVSVTVTSPDGSHETVYRVWIASPAAGAPPPDGEPTAGCLRGEIAPGFSLVVFEGGSVEQLGTCARSLGVTALHALDGGGWASYILGAPDFVNEAFRELFPHGLPPDTPLVARSNAG